VNFSHILKFRILGLDKKATQKVAQIEVDTLTRAVIDLKISTDKFVAQIPTLKDKVNPLKTWWWMG
jgi:hypothetical protein